MEKQHGMKRKTIKSVIKKKVNQWLDSIDDPKVKELCQKNTIVSGGCISSMLLGEKVNDFDIYFRNIQTTKKVAEYYVKKFKLRLKEKKGIETPIKVVKEQDIQNTDRIKIVVESAGVEKENNNQEYHYFESRAPEEAGDYVSEVFDSPEEIADITEEVEENIKDEENINNDKTPFRPVFLSTNAITLSNKMQLILRFYGEPKSIHQNYDFVHCMHYWDSKSDELKLNSKGLESMLSKTLIYNGSRYPVCSIFRLRKFINRGWRINAGQILKMILQISELNLSDYKVLEDQLTGVDVAYFREVLNKISLKDQNEKIDQTYLIEILDRMFGE